MKISQLLISGACANLIGHIVRLAAAVVLPPFVIAIIGTEDYGVIVIATTVMAFVTLVQAGAPSALSRFLSEASVNDESDNFREVLSTGALLFFLLSVAAFLGSLLLSFFPTLFFSESSPSFGNARFVIATIGVVAALNIFSCFASTILYVKHKFTILNAVRIVNVFIRVALILAFVYWYETTFSYFYGLVLSSFIALLLMVIFALKHIEKNQISLSKISSKKAKNIFSYGLTVFLYSSLYLLYIQANYILVGKFLGPSEVTILNLAFVWGVALRGLVVSAVSVLAPSASMLNVQNDQARLQLLFIRVTKYSLLICLPMVLFLTLFRHQIFNLWMGPGYELSAMLMVPVMIGEFFAIAEAGGAQICLATGNIRFLILTNILFGVINILSVVLICHYADNPLLYISIVYAVALTVRSGLLTPFYVVWKFGFGLRQFLFECYGRAGLVLLCLSPVIIYSLSQISLTVMESVVLTAFMGVLFLFGLVVFGFDRYDRNLIYEFYGSVRARLFGRHRNA